MTLLAYKSSHLLCSQVVFSMRLMCVIIKVMCDARIFFNEFIKIAKFTPGQKRAMLTHADEYVNQLFA